jgi:diguanylate cyclase (GGDEF)-like protein
VDADSFSREVVSLLEVCESAQVPQWISRRLCALLDASRAQVLQVFPVAAARRKEAAAGRFAVTEGPHALPVPVGLGSALARALESRKPVNDTGEVWVPLVALDEVRYAVGVIGPRERVQAIERLFPVIAAYFGRLVDAETDPLTQLANRRAFYSEVSAGLPLWAKSPERHFIAVADIDHFKQVNDRYGHLYGDEILIHFARLMRRTFRAGDRLFRFGGEEFVAVFGVEDEGMRPTPLERFRKATEQYEFPMVGRVTVSIGVAPIGDGSVPVTTLIDHADQALYYAKTHGRNRLCDYEELRAAGELGGDAKPAESDVTLF